MQSLDFQLVIQCPLETTFAIYTDIDRWRFRSLFGNIQWVHGRPWEEGSRLQIETHVPLRSTIDQVVQTFIPNKSVSYLSHVLGMTCETQVFFHAASEKETLVRVAMQMVGTLSRSLGFAIEPMIAKSTRGFFEEFKKECETFARNAQDLERRSSTPPAGETGSVN